MNSLSQGSSLKEDEAVGGMVSLRDYDPNDFSITMTDGQVHAVDDLISCGSDDSNRIKVFTEEKLLGIINKNGGLTEKQCSAMLDSPIALWQLEIFMSAFEHEAFRSISKWAALAIQSHLDTIGPTIDLSPIETERLKITTRSLIVNIVEEAFKIPWWSSRDRVLYNERLYQTIGSFLREKPLKPALREILISLALNIQSLIKPRR